MVLFIEKKDFRPIGANTNFRKRGGGGMDGGYTTFPSVFALIGCQNSTVFRTQ
jgi:hypothetical protein